MARISRARMKTGQAALNELPAAGHARQQMLKRRADVLEQVAEEMSDKEGIYSIDPEKLKEQPEILKHLKTTSFGAMEFEVTNPVPGYAYCWVREDQKAIAQKRTEGRFHQVHDAWEIVQAGDSLKKDPHSQFPESQETKTAEGTRRIGDCILMRIKLESYVEIQKHIVLMNAYRELGVSQKLDDFIKEFGGKVQVFATNEEPRLFLQKQGIVGPGRNQGARGPIPMGRQPHLATED